MKILAAMVKKDFRLLVRDKMTLFFTFGFPIIFASFFGSIMSGGGNGPSLSIAVTDLDATPQSQQFVERMIEAEEFVVEVLPEEEAKNLTRRGRKVAYVILPPGFGAKYGSLFTGGAPELIIGVDPSRQAEAGIIQGSLMKLAVSRFENAFGNTEVLNQQLDDTITILEQDQSVPADWKTLLSDFLPKIKELNQQNPIPAAGEGDDDGGASDVMTPLKLTTEDVVVNREGPKNGFAVTIPQAMYWAIMGIIMGFGTSLVQEKAFGTMTRLVAAPVSRLQILLGKSIGCFIAICIVVTALFLIANKVFAVPIESPLKLALALFCVATGFVGIMMFIASIGRTERGVAGLGWGVMMIFAMFGGAMLPLFAMPGWMQSVSDFSPVKWAILSFEGATWRNFSYQEMMLPLGIMLAMGIVFFAIGTRTLKLEE